jgi:hypothetical protein
MPSSEASDSYEGVEVVAPARPPAPDRERSALAPRQRKKYANAVAFEEEGLVVKQGVLWCTFFKCAVRCDKISSAARQARGRRQLLQEEPKGGP